MFQVRDPEGFVKAKEILYQSFRRGESFGDALKQIKEEVLVDPELQTRLKAKWAVYEIYGDDIYD